MFPAFALTLALMAPAAPIPKDVAPAGPAPYILNLKSENDGKVRFTVLRNEKVKVTRVQFQGGPNGQQVPVQIESDMQVTRYVRVELADLKDVKVYTTEGKEVDLKDAVKKLGDTTMAVASANGQKVDPAFLKLFKDDVLILVSPDLAPNGRANPATATGWRGEVIMQPPGGVVPLPAPAMPPLQALPPLQVVPVAPPVVEKPALKKD